MNIIRYKKRTMITLAVVTTAVLILAAVIYFKLYRIDTEGMGLCVGQGSFESPDGNYMIDIGVYPIGDIPPSLDVDEILPYVIQNDIAAYTIGRLKRDPIVRSDGAKVWSGEDSKVIYFDKYNGAEIPVAWKDETTVKIGGIDLKVPDQVFDYRRNW